ncbi:unnamed protein product [Mytilus coruscus]|uniref:Reverse transcriptase zinc-binding domain-containing protein n=1 Tax=Mytilus coruscus TaxID=42192 RepID=A0A6J8E759_MYTCO|nr:unnamed protein product [Mytilus coruscus]
MSWAYLQFRYAFLLGTFNVYILYLIILAGDVELNPRPNSESEVSSVSSVSDGTLDGFNACLSAYTSFVHLNVQSLVPKLDIINAELKSIDVLSFSETWLNSNVNDQDILLGSYHPPLRNDRVGRNDLVIANKRNVIDLVHVGHPFLNANIRYHCPTFGIIKIEKPSQTCFKRRIWLYDRGDLNLFREKLSAVNRENFIIDGNNDVDLPVESFTQILLKTAAESIPNKIITVRKTDPPWINNTIRRAIRKRNRMNKRAKKSNLPEHWSKFRKFRNKTSNISDENMSVPTDDTPPVTCLDNIILQEHEVKDILQITNVNKASGPDGISPRLLKIASDILAKPLCYIFNLKYADVIWDNCPEYLKDRLEQINYEAGRIVTGATKLTSLQILLKETGWETLRERRKNHKLILFHQMANNNSPAYLSNLVPTNFGQSHPYGTRNAGNVPHMPARTTYYHNSFLPSTVRLWNEIPINIRNSSLYIFKKYLKKTWVVPKYFYSGSRLGQILHTRIRTESSGLNEHLYRKNLVTDPFCKCRQIETSEHFLLRCPQYQLLREFMLSNLSCQPNIHNLLYGNPLMSDIENTDNFLIIQDFILKTKRFV